MALNDREKLFVIHYIRLGEAYPAALEAGYADSTAKESSKWINPEILKNPNKNESKKFKPEVYAAVQEEMQKLLKPATASAEEVLEYLTSVMRKQSLSSVLARDELGAERIIQKPPDEKESLKAAEMLGKRWGIWDKKQDTEPEAQDDGFLDAIRGEVAEVWQQE
jgi:phage terminase small subunit